MAKRKRSNRQRDNKSIASSLLSNRIHTLLSDIEDRRQFHPLDDIRPAKGLSRFGSMLHVSPVGDRAKARKVQRSGPETFKFNIPSGVAVCVRRQQRREVLFALKRSGKGSKSQSRSINYYSHVWSK